MNEIKSKFTHSILAVLCLFSVFCTLVPVKAYANPIVMEEIMPDGSLRYMVWENGKLLFSSPIGAQAYGFLTMFLAWGGEGLVFTANMYRSWLAGSLTVAQLQAMAAASSASTAGGATAGAVTAGGAATVVAGAVVIVGAAYVGYLAGELIYWKTANMNAVALGNQLDAQRCRAFFSLADVPGSIAFITGEQVASPDYNTYKNACDLFRSMADACVSGGLARPPIPRNC